MSYQRKVFIGDSSYLCGLNYQHILIEQEIRNRDIITNDPREADVIVFAGTCACTIEKMQSYINYINSVLEYVPDRSQVTVYLTGCLSRTLEIDNDFFRQVNRWKEETFDFVIPHYKPYELLSSLYPDQGFELLTEQYGLSIYNPKYGQDELFLSAGCRNNCTFCKKNYLQWPLKSIPLEDAKREIDKIVQKEEYDSLELIGANISQYGLDLYDKPMLSEIIEYLEKASNINNYGITGLNFYDAERYGFGDVLRDSEKLCSIGGSLESGSNRLLKLMKKNGRVEDFIAFAKHIKSKYPRDLFLAIIAGFPTETIKDVRLTLDALKEIDPYFVGISRYTDSRYIPSHNIPQLSPEEIQYHARLYEKVLTKRRVLTNITMPGYVNNGKY